MSDTVFMADSGQSKYQFLRMKKNVGWPIKKWSEDNLKDGINYFFDLHGRYPTVKDVDSFEHLPTSRTIQRSFGGMMALRKALGLNGPINFTEGAVRADVAREADLRARKYEEEFYRFATSKVEEMRVHEHKIMRPGNTAADFFIYKNGTEGIVIDLFYARDMHSLGGIVNIKSKKYLSVGHPVYFVLVGNEEITQEMIDKKIKNRKNQLSRHIRVVTERYVKESFFDLLEN